MPIIIRTEVFSSASRVLGPTYFRQFFDDTENFPESKGLDSSSIELLFSDSDQFLDFDYPIGIHNSGSDSIVPVQPMKSAQSTAKQMVDPSWDNYIEIDFTNSKFNSFNSSAAPAGGTQEGEVDVGGGGSGDDEVSVVEVVVENSGNEMEEAGGVSGGDS
ncbi:hypothetical protein Vadar_032341 [Vaccinium darrowii]|uniref:Uncharacterized protein n=1 Tax=Vaccinium darrowii TaxID=229202 RepID=A0ACB7X5L5_9ERIC|nr:hypothetical protein Vadar_032341 [Vaccinium darrowii]